MNHVIFLLGLLLPEFALARDSQAVLSPIHVAYCEEVAAGGSLESAGLAADALEARLRGRAINGILMSLYNRGLRDGSLVFSPAGTVPAEASELSPSPVAPVTLRVEQSHSERILGIAKALDLHVARDGLEIVLEIKFIDGNGAARRYQRRFSYEEFSATFPRNRISIDPLLRGWEPTDGDWLRFHYEQTLVDPFYAPGRDFPVAFRSVNHDSGSDVLLRDLAVILGFQPYHVAASFFDPELGAHRVLPLDQAYDPIDVGDRLLLPGSVSGWALVRRTLVVGRDGDHMIGFDEATREYFRFRPEFMLSHAANSFFLYRQRRGPNFAANFAQQMSTMFRGSGMRSLTSAEWQRIPDTARALPDFDAIVRERLRAGFSLVQVEQLVREQIETGRYPELRLPDRANQALNDFIAELKFGDELYFFDKRRRLWRTFVRVSGRGQEARFRELETAGLGFADDDLPGALGASLNGADFFRLRVEPGTLFLRRRP